MTFISKEQFLAEHNKLSPASLQVTLAMLNRFQEEKRPQLEDNGWSLDKLRVPLISWIISASVTKKDEAKKGKKEHIFKNYPETHYQA